jgi:hypothetical protein
MIMNDRTASSRKSRAKIATFLLAAGLAMIGADACGSTTTFVARPFDIQVSLNPATPTNSVDARIPLTWDPNHPQTIVVDLQVRDDSLAPYTDLTDIQSWVNITTNTGSLFNLVGPAGPKDPNVSGLSVKLTNGAMKGLTLQLVGAYGNVVVSAAAIGYVPAFTKASPECNDGIDNDGNGYADFNVAAPAKKDPNCYSQYDDYEGPFDSFFGASDPSYFAFPTIADVRSSTPTPFAGQLVSINGTPQHTIVVTRIADTGMYITDLGGLPTQANSLFVFNFNAPANVLACDTLSNVAGTMSDFYGFTEMGTPAWTNVQWPGPSSGTPCLIPDFIELNVAANINAIGQYESALTEVKNPIFGNKFGQNTPPGPSFLPVAGASNCDINHDGIVGYESGATGYSAVEAACSNACDADPNCSEWNNFIKEAEVKINFLDDATPPAIHTLFFSPSAAADYDLTDPKYQGPGVFQSIRGTIGVFSPATPADVIEPRCDDDIVLVGQDPSTIKTAQTGCVHPRDGSDQEGSQ